jgi:hypothetical protein
VIATRWGLAHQLQSWIRFTDWRRCWWLLPGLDVLEGFTYLGAFMGRSVTWAGRRYGLRPDGTLTVPGQNHSHPSVARESRAGPSRNPG